MSRDRRIVSAIALTLFLLAGCSKSPTGSSMGTMRLRMTDSPAAYDAVNLVVTEVSVHREGGTDSTSGWEVLNSQSATYDLLTLQNGVFVQIAESSLPAGRYTQVRLRLGAGSNVVVGGVPYPLVVPSGMQSGLKLVGSFDVPENGLLELLLDFDAERSIHQTGSGTYMLKPTVRVIPTSTAGAIRGSLSPAGTAATVYAIQSADTLASATAAADGSFMMSVLAQGFYSLAFHPVSGYRDTTISGVAVTAGATTTVPEVALTAQ